MISIEEVKKWLIANCLDERGNLNISGLDFSDFNGDINISGMRVKGDLNQANQKVEGDLRQSFQEVKGMLSQSWQKVEGNLHQYCQEVKGILHQGCQKVEGKMFLQDTSELQKAFDNDGVIYYEKVEKIPEMTLEEIEPKLDTEYFNIAQNRIKDAQSQGGCFDLSTNADSEEKEEEEV